MQGIIAIGLIVVLGSFVDTILYTAAPVYMFYLATSLAVIVLRSKEPHVERPYRVTGYPFTTIIFCAVCAFLIYSTVSYAWSEKTNSLYVLGGVLAAGMLIYWLTDVRGSVRGRSEKDSNEHIGLD